jgi:hypothetical protein
VLHLDDYPAQLQNYFGRVVVGAPYSPGNLRCGGNRGVGVTCSY